MILPALGVIPADFRDGFLHFLQHEGPAVVRDLCRIGLEHIRADPPEDGILNPGVTLPMRQDFADGNTRPNCGAMIVHSHPAQFPDDVDDPFGIQPRQT